MTDAHTNRHLAAWILWPLGLIGLPFGHWCLFARVDPFYSAIYTFLWWPAIFTVDLVVYLLRKNSLLHDRPREFLLLMLWSTPVWLIFEACNLRLANWYYVQVPLALNWESFFLLPAFATVLPGVFELTELFVGVIERLTKGRGLKGPAFRVTGKHIYYQMAFGAAMLALPLAWPARFFCLTWGFAFFLLDPICYMKKGRSLLGQLARGDNTRFAALLLSGVVCGGVWEAWNIAARSKWIYTVPFFDQLKLGEMPILGFLGFPPFVLECYAIINFISLFRGGRSWELSREENARRRGMTSRGAVWSWLVVIALSVATMLAVFQWTVSSYSFPIDRYLETQLGPEGVAALRREGARFTHQFLRKWGDGPGEEQKGVAKSPSTGSRPSASRQLGISPELFERLRVLSRMADLKGMGLDYALALEALGIRTAEDLARHEPGILSRQIQRLSGRSSHPTEARVKVWIREARRRGSAPNPA